MSRGLGKIERAILQHLQEMSRSYYASLLTLTIDVCGYSIHTDPSEIKRTDYNKVSRACVSLEEKGYVKSSYIPKILHPPLDYNSTKVPPPRHVRNWYRKIIWLKSNGPNSLSNYFL